MDNLAICRVVGEQINNPDVSVIIPLYKSREDVKYQIRSWPKTNHLKVEIIYVEDNCPQNSKMAVFSTWKEKNIKESCVRLIFLTENRGFGGACNVGAYHANGKYLVFLNADTIVTEDWLNAIIEPFSDPKIGIVGNLQIKDGGQWDGTIDGAGSEWYWSSMQFEHIGRHIYNGLLLKQPMKVTNLEKREVEMVTGCCFAIPKLLFDEIGGFNLNYKIAYWEDSEICMTVREKGYKIVFQPKSIIYHKLSKSQATAHPYHEWNKFYFINKWVRTKRLDNLVKATRPMQFPEIESILLCRKEAFGDVLLASAVASALKIKYPNSKISFITNCKEILKGNKHIDKIVEEKDVLAKDYDLCFNFDLEYERRPFTNILQSYADMVGVPIENCNVFLERKTTDIPRKPYIVFHPGRTNWIGRNWHDEKFEELAREVKKLGFDIVCTGKENDRFVPCDMDLRGKTNLNELAYVIFSAKLFVGIDSLAMHIAQAMKTPGVCFFGAIDPKTRIFQKNMLPVLKSDLPCIGCHHKQLPPATCLNICKIGTLDCENLVTIEMMLGKIKDALGLS